MLFRYLHKLAINVVVVLFISFKNFVRKARAKFVNKANVTVIEVTSTWPSDITRCYKLVKSRRSRSVQFN